MKWWMRERDELIEQTLAFVEGVAAARPARTAAAASARAEPAKPLEQAGPAEPPKPAGFAPIRLAPIGLAPIGLAPIRLAPMASERAEIERRVANFKAQQQKFQRAREADYDAIFAKARATPGNLPRPCSNLRRAPPHPPAGLSLLGARPKTSWWTFQEHSPPRSWGIFHLLSHRRSGADGPMHAPLAVSNPPITVARTVWRGTEVDILIFLLKYIGGPLLAIVVTLSLTEPIKERLAPLVARFGSKKEDGIQGKWLAIFEFGSPPVQYAEVIEVSSLVGLLVGRIVPDSRNHPSVAKIADSKPVRVRGSLKDHSFFTGVWLHPSKRSHQMGAYQLLVSKSNDSMRGVWLGYSERDNAIESGNWVWKRLDN
jgi:hypothetical protein